MVGAPGTVERLVNWGLTRLGKKPGSFEAPTPPVLLLAYTTSSPITPTETTGIFLTAPCRPRAIKARAAAILQSVPGIRAHNYTMALTNAHHMLQSLPRLEQSVLSGLA